MQVMCVKPFNNNNIIEQCKNAPRPDVGDECQVTHTVMSRQGFNYYMLKEFPGYNYLSTHFAILPEQSADQMQEENREAILNLETTIV
jgi:hypothetical protein